MAKRKKKITADQIAFAESYIESLNQTAAYMATHPNSSRESAWRNGSRLMRNDEVRAYIEAKITERHMGSNEVLARLADQARGTMYRFVEVDDDGHVYFDFGDPEAKGHMHLIKKVKSKRKREVVLAGKNAPAVEWVHEWVEVDLHDAQAALQLLGRHHKLFTDRVESVNTLNVEGLKEVLDRVYGRNK